MEQLQRATQLCTVQVGKDTWKLCESCCRQELTRILQLTASSYGYLEAVQELLEAGADKDIAAQMVAELYTGQVTRDR